MTGATGFLIRQRGNRELAGDRLEVGTRSSMGLVLDDPIAAEHHATILFRDGCFQLEPCETATGTYLNGLQVTQPCRLSSGDRLVIGVSRVLFSIEPESPELLVLDVDEQSFFFTKKQREEFESDSDEWVRSEVDFGKLKGLRSLNAVALLLGAALLGLLGFSSAGEEALQPGKLSAVHVAAVSKEAMSCSACHDPFSGVTNTRCVDCHEEHVQPEADAELPRGHMVLAASPEQGFSCVSCHKEHHGGVEPLGKAFGWSEGGGGLKDCQACHAADPDYTDEAFDGKGLLVEDSALLDRALAVLYDGRPEPDPVEEYSWGRFDHASHVLKVEIQCSACHEPTGLEEGLEFQLPTFEAACAACHGPELGTDEGGLLADWRRDALIGDAGLALAATVHEEWHLDWHGSDDCTTCHEQAFQGELRQAQVREREPARFELVSRGHDDLVHADTTRDCSDCHVNGGELEAGLDRGALPFDHSLHLSPGDPDQGQCLECHTGIQESQGLADLFQRGAAIPDSLPSCADCHGDSPVLSPVAADSGEFRERDDFPHSRHAGLDCSDCHVPGDDGATMVSLEGAATCADCHYERGNHQNLAGLEEAGCALCHPGTADEPHGAFLGLLADREASRPESLTGFRHDQEGHDSPDCRSCHLQEDNLFRGREMTQADPSCVQCHVARRFHW